MVADSQYFCAAAARDRGDRIHATAERATAWVLLEFDGAWGPHDVEDSALPDQLKQQIIAHTSKRPGTRFLLIKGPESRTSPSRRVFVFNAGRPDQSYAWDIERDAVDLGDIEAALDGRGSSLNNKPLVVVCTHGTRDKCCARYGLPVYRSLRENGANVWECSHVGGDRFAANLVCFPHALFFGYVPPESAPSIYSSYLRGDIELEWYRGHGAFARAVQAAEIALRTRFRWTSVASLNFLSSTSGLGGELLCHFLGPDARSYHVTVRKARTSAAAFLTCKVEEPSTQTVFESQIGEQSDDSERL